MKKRKGVGFPQKGDDPDILHFQLPDLLPSGRSLALHMGNYTLSILGSNGEGTFPQMVREEQFTQAETGLLVALLSAHPDYCSFASLFAHYVLAHEAITDEVIEKQNQHLVDVYEAGLWEEEVRPLRNTLSRVRIKLRAFQIDIRSILETGYMLKKLDQNQRQRKEK